LTTDTTINDGGLLGSGPDIRSHQPNWSKVSQPIGWDLWIEDFSRLQ